jgi:hypothetical protein
VLFDKIVNLTIKSLVAIIMRLIKSAYIGSLNLPIEALLVGAMSSPCQSYKSQVPLLFAEALPPARRHDPVFYVKHRPKLWFSSGKSVIFNNW